MCAAHPMGANEEALAWISAGGNTGDVAAALAAARAALTRRPGGPVRASGLYESEPWGLPGQPPFLNQVLSLPARGTPRALLRRLKALERAAGRTPGGRRWGPRPLDLDLLVWPGVVQSDPSLTLPHPRLAERRFVLVPWAEIAPALVVPGLERTVAELLGDCPDASWVRPWPSP